MQVFIAEKPSQGRDIARILGCHHKGNGFLSNQNTVVTWGFGHLLQPANPDRYDEKYKRWVLEDLPIIPEKWKLDANPNSVAQLKIVKGWLAKATEVVISTDADREGELIARLILGNARYTGSVKRLWLSALDDASIKKGLANLKDGKETEPLFWAGLGRQRADWMTGMSYTRASTIVFGGQGNVFSVGRVQTPTLRLIVERDLLIENFVSKAFFTITGIFDQTGKTVSCEWIVPDHAKGDDEGRCLDRSIAENVKQKCEKKEAKIIAYDTKKKEQPAPLIFSLSELQKTANVRYGYDAKKVLETAQSLYEKHKATTYPRSDCTYLPMSQFEEVPQILANLKPLNQAYAPLIEECDPTSKSKVWNDKKVSESSHHGIIPTNNPKVNINAMSEMERNVFDLISRYYIAQFMGKYVYNETIIEIECEQERFKTKGIVPIEPSWKKAIASDTKKKGNDTPELPVLDKNLPIDCQAIKIKDKKTTPPQHYTDATLLSAMKNCGRQVDDADAKKMLSEVQGIGTEATRADIMETLKARQYIRSKGKYLISETKGRELIRLLPDPLSSVIITAEWEQKLTEVAKGRMEYKEFISGIQNNLIENIKLITGMNGKVKKMVQHPCPKCGEGLIRLKNKQAGKGFWWGCTGFKNGCKITMDDSRGKPVPPNKCPTCNRNNLAKRDGKDKTNFWACRGYPECKATFKDEKGKPVLPKLEKA